MINDRVQTRLLICCGFLEIILFEVQRKFSGSQVYLEYLFKAIFILSYYGMMRVGEVTLSPHVLRAKNVHLALNKDKLLLILYSSKTHDLRHNPQKIKITSNKQDNTGSAVLHRHFCPFTILRIYLKLRGNYDSNKEPFFIFRDKQPVTATHPSRVLKEIIQSLGLDSTLYSMHSFRIGRTSDLIKFNVPIETVKRLGRWKSNAVYKYIKM